MQDRRSWGGGWGSTNHLLWAWVGLVVPPPHKCEEEEDAGVFSASLRVCICSLLWGTRETGTAARCREHGE